MMRASLLILVLTSALMGSDERRLEPLIGLPPFPADNPPTAAKIKLGEELFFETALSGDGRRSCSTCHKPELYFTDGFSRGWGLNETELRRKTPSILNVGWQQSMFFDGREKTLEDQASKPLENPNEMDSDPEQAARRIAASGYYRRLFDEAFPGEEITFAVVAKAIASYERTLISQKSELDRFLLGDESALTPAAKRGMELFTGRAGCIRCHHGPMLTDHQKHYTGVPENNGDSKPGTKYKTQSLRDVMRRYSYMHNGDLMKMDDVLDHYTRGGSAPAGLKAEIEPLDLSEPERQDLIAFLGSLSGQVSELLDDSQISTETFGRLPSGRLREGPPQTGSDEEAASQPPLDPSYIKPQAAQQQGPVTDPNYVRPNKR
jgi:cytochrome c peroxidase